MSHPLAPLRHVYDVEPPIASAGDPATNGDSVETDLLRGMRRVLDARPAAAPSESALQAVLDRASSASSTSQPLYEAYAATAPLTGEAELLRQSRLVLDQAISSRPRPRPDADVEALVLARAAEASGVVRDAAPDARELVPVAAAYGLASAAGVEAAVLASTRDALDRLPLHQPDASTLDAVLAQAALASAPRETVSGGTPAPDRAAAAPAARRRRMGGIWAGSAALVAVVLIAVFAFPSTGTEPDSQAVLADAAPEATPSEPPSSAANSDAVELAVESEAPVLSAPLASTAPPPLVQRSAPRGPAAAERTPVRASRAASPAPAPPSSARAEASEAMAETASVPAWNVSDDVRLLSLRLQELRRQNQGLAWDAPAESFGAPATTGSAQPGIQAVREGTAPVRAQVRIRSDSARSNQ